MNNVFDFNKPYNRKEFTEDFLDSFLPEDFEIYEEEINKIDKQLMRIKKVIKLGESETLELSVYEIQHDSENDPRITLTRDSFKLMDEFALDNALFIFVNKKNDNYRFSYIQANYKKREKGVKKEYTSPRRFSYFLGKDAKINTPTQYLIKKGKIKNIDDLRDRFSIEVVNKEFYNDIAYLFTELIGGKRKINSKNIEKKGLLKFPTDNKIEKQNFAIRLMGRIIFNWFLIKKGLVPEELFTSDVMDREYKGGNYYHRVLEPLFFKILNTPIEKRQLNKFKIDNYLKKQFAKIPFLNGGLFEAHKDDYFVIDETGYSIYELKLKIPNKWFEKLFELFGKYNFTVDESSIFDIEISVDPEMLGRVFENLLAEINPETGETARKRTGSYYTPREIVDYMVSESLKYYLMDKTNINKEKIEKLLTLREQPVEHQITKEEIKIIIDALHKIRILDPACGSGAFPMGILQKIIFILDIIDPNSKLWLDIKTKGIDPLLKQQLFNKGVKYQHKLGLIRDSIYGIDIQPIAVEISKLRVYLSLIVDEEIDRNNVNGNFGIEPLPNLDFKFVCANTLIDINNIVHAKDKLDLQIEEFYEFEKLEHEYFSSTDKKDKIELKNKIKKLIDRIIEKETRDVKLGKISANNFGRSITNKQQEEIKLLELRNRLLKSYKNIFENKPIEFFNIKYFFPEITDGFDVVIANPPYIQIQKFRGKEEQRLWKLQGYESFDKMGDVYCLFYEKGLELLNDKGVLCYITSNKWMRAGYGEKLREFFSKKTNPLILIDFGGYKIFENATVDTNILILKKENNKNKTLSCTIRSDFSKGMNIEEYFEKNKMSNPFNNSKAWIIMDEKERRIKEKIEKYGTPLKDWDIKIYRGVLTGYNEAFIIDGKKKDELIAKDPKSAEIIKPILRGRDIKRYKANFADKWLINTHNGYINSKGEKIQPIDINDYPAIKEHLDQYWIKLKKRDDKGKTPYNLRNCAYLEEFEKEKIVYQEIVREAGFYYDIKKFYCEATTFLITGKELKYIIALLNSKPVTFFFKNFYAGGGLGEDGYRYKKMFLENLPIPQIPKSEQKPFEELVDIILKKKQKGEDTTLEERQIDKMVYKLYHLTDEEIRIVEGG